MNPPVLPAENVWEDLVDDFLEIACGFPPEERRPLLEALRAGRPNVAEIRECPAFLVGDCLVVTARAGRAPGFHPAECWFYHPEKGQITKIRLPAAKGPRPPVF